MDFRAYPNVKLYALDVTHLESIITVFKSKEEYATLDVVVNNAGYGVDGAFEAMTDAVIEKQFDTNVLD